MNKTISKRIKKVVSTKTGLIVLTVLELVLAYAVASLAIDRGNLLYYLLTVIFLGYAITHTIRLIGKFVHERKAS